MLSKMQPPLRIAILECAYLSGPLAKEEFGTYGKIFDVMLKAGAIALNNSDQGYHIPEDGLDITCWDAIEAQEYPELEDVDAVLITGSRSSAVDDDPWIQKLLEFTNKVLAQDRVRIIGVCFGHQILGTALGAKAGKATKGWELSVLPMDMSGEGEKVFGRRKLSLQQMHQDELYDYPADVEKMGSSDLCNVQGMHVKGRLLSMQGHPEFNEGTMRELLQGAYDKEAFEQKIYDDAVSRVGLHHDGILVSEAFLKFLLDE